MGAAPSADATGNRFRAIVYNQTYSLPKEDQISIDGHFVDRLVGTPVTIEHAYEKLYDVFDKISAGTPAERISELHRKLGEMHNTVGDITSAKVSELTGSLVVEFQLRDVASKVLEELHVKPEQLCGIGTSLTHGISSEGLHPVELALTANPQRKGCRLISPVHTRKSEMAEQQQQQQQRAEQASSSKKTLASVLGKLSPLVRKELEDELEKSGLPGVFAKLPVDVRKELFEVPELRFELKAAAEDIAAEQAAAAPATTTGAAAAKSASAPVVMAAEEASMIIELLKGAVSERNGGTAAPDLPSNMASNMQMSILAYSLGMNRQLRQQEQTRSEPEPAPKQPRVQRSRLESMAAGPIEFRQ